LAAKRHFYASNIAKTERFAFEFQTLGKDMTNNELNEKLIALARTERRITKEILELINEVELRRLHNEMGYSSLFEYLTKYLGYCESSAYRRMQAARLLREIPAVKEAFVNGRIQLTQMAKVQTAAKAQKRTVTTTEKQEILRLVTGKNLDETKQVLAQALPTPEKKASISYGREHIILTLRLSSEQFKKLQQVKALLSHVNPRGNFEAVFEKLCDDLIKKRIAYGSRLRKEIFAKYNYECQYPGCGSKYFLELEHIQPRSLGGTDAPENLTILCRAHNQLSARRAGLM
jgi:hypothetical protein